MSLYLHTRQYAAAVSVRHHFLTLRPQMRSSWIGLMVAHHLNGDIPAALDVYEGLKSCTTKAGGTGPEKAQTLLYVIKLSMEQGDNEAALSELQEGLERKIISPRGEVSQMRGESR
jgi:DNA-binding SARP family transcriptional activator